MKKMKHTVIIGLFVICLVFAIITTFNYSMFDLFAYSSNPTYFWQYFSGAIMHGSKLAPIGLIWFHLLANFNLIFNFGWVIESKRGSKYSFIIFIVSLVITSIASYIALYGRDIQSCGISGIAYAYIAAGTIYYFKNWNIVSLIRKVVIIILLLLSLITLLPFVLGWSSTIVHVSGIISYLLVLFGEKLLSKKGD